MVTGSVLLGGCASQIEALAPVGGDDLATVRIASTDVLLGLKLSILEAPQCTQTPAAITCLGTLTDGSTVRVEAPGRGRTTMTVTVSGDVIYDGAIQDVLDETSRVAS